MPVLLQPAYVLHRRAYRETSFLLEIFSQDYGCLSVIARGVRKMRSPLSGLLQPFSPLLVSWSGKGELMTLTHTESRGGTCRLHGDCLFAGFYLNELLFYLLQKWDSQPRLFTIYENTLQALQKPILEPKILRSFEKYLLTELGYAIFPSSEHALTSNISVEKYYRFIPEQGFVISEMSASPSAQTNIFLGEHLLAIANENWADEEVLRAAKRLTQLLLLPLLGAKALHSRRLLKFFPSSSPPCAKG